MNTTQASTNAYDAGTRPTVLVLPPSPPTSLPHEGSPRTLRAELRATSTPDYDVPPPTSPRALRAILRATSTPESNKPPRIGRPARRTPSAPC